MNKEQKQPNSLDNYLYLLVLVELVRTGPARLALIHGHQRQNEWIIWSFARQINTLYPE